MAISDLDLWRACRHGRFQYVKEHLAADRDLNSIKAPGPLLHAAVVSGSIPLIEHLIHRGMDVNMPDSSGETPLVAAVLRSQPESLRCLISHGANLEQELVSPKDPAYHQPKIWNPNRQASDAAARQEQRRVIHVAAQEADPRTLQVLLEYRPQINTSTAQGLTALHFASVQTKHHSVDNARLLIAAGADPNQPNLEGRTPFHEAALHGTLDMLRYLASVGDVNAPIVDCDEEDPGHTTAGHCIAYSDDDTIRLSILVEHGYNLDAINDVGKTPRDLAQQQGNHRIVAYIDSLKALNVVQSASIDSTPKPL